MQRLLRFAAALALLPTAAAAADGQARELSWPEVNVDARLDADGRLHVREVQVMRFTGDWNGGQRIFANRFGQELRLESLERLDATTGSWTPLVRGDLSRVDAYDWTDGNTLRWRSRRPDDPPFAGTEITYALEFTYSNILQPRGDGAYLLDHDFAFANREGVFSRFVLALEVDSAWSTSPGFTGRYVATDLPPGEGFVVTVPLTRTAGTPPAGVRFGAGAGVRQALLAALVVALVGLFAKLVVRERTLGRATPLPPAGDITPEWLEDEVFAFLPEVVGAEWDNETASPEVAATLARLVQERKLSSSVRTKSVLIFKQHVLHLELLVQRNQFQQHERALIDALFDAGERTTDTERVRKRYQKTGFDPASVIRARLGEMTDHITRPGGETPSRVPTLVLLAAAAVLLALGLREHVADGAVAAVVVAGSVPVYLIAVAFAHAWRRRVMDLWSGTLGFLVPLGLAVGAVGLLLLLQGRFALGPLVLTGIVVWLIAMANSVFNVASSRQSPGRIARRKRLAAAREYFRDELSKPSPGLRDEWFPYVLAFGLNGQIDRWFKAYGGAEHSASRSAAFSSGLGAGGSSSSNGGSWTGFGGGGGFGGAGGGASFGAALGGMAASVPSPSSSSGGGGGGGGGGSSGGGGGGGW